MKRGILIGKLLAYHDLWASGYITTDVWQSRALPLMRQLHQLKGETQCEATS